MLETDKSLTPESSWFSLLTMITTVTTKNMVTIPAALSRKMGITPGFRLDWQEPADGSSEVRVRIIPTRAVLARQLMGSAAKWSPERDAVRDLIEERAGEDLAEG